MRRRASPLGGGLVHSHSQNTSGVEGDVSTTVSPLKVLLPRPKRQNVVHRRHDSQVASQRKKEQALPLLPTSSQGPSQQAAESFAAALPQASPLSALRNDDGEAAANVSGDHHISALDPSQLEQRLAELRSAILVEKRARHKLKQKCIAQLKDLSAVQRDHDLIQTKLQSAHALLTSCEGFNKAALAESIASVDNEAEVVMVELRAAERELSALHAAEGSKHRASLQNTVTSIRVNDERKKVAAARKKVAELEAHAAALRSEVEGLKRSREGITGAVAALTSSSSSVALSRGHRSNVAAPVSAALGSAAAKDINSGNPGGKDDDMLKSRQKRYTIELSKLQDEVTRDAKQAQQDGAKLLEDVIRANHALTTEAAHLEQQRQMKEREVAVLLLDVERLSKAVERCRKAREEAEAGKQLLIQQQSAVREQVLQLQHRIQEATAGLNQLILMSSDAPVMHEKAWAQERAGLQATLNTVLAKNKKMEGDKQVLASKVEAIRVDLAAIDKLKIEEAAASTKVKALQGTLTAVQHQLASLSLDDDGSQKRNIVADLEGAIRLEKRRVEELLGLNQRLEQKLSSLRSLLQQHGFDIC